MQLSRIFFDLHLNAPALFPCRQFLLLMIGCYPYIHTFTVMDGAVVGLVLTMPHPLIPQNNNSLVVLGDYDRLGSSIVIVMLSTVREDCSTPWHTDTPRW